MASRDADRLTSSAELQSIRLVGAEVGTRVLSQQDAGPVSIFLDKQISAELSDESSRELSVRLSFSVHIVPEVQREEPLDEDDLLDPLVWVKPDYELRYQLTDGERPTEEELRQFADATATFNAWPYFREFVQSMMARMNLPRVTIPLLRRQPAPMLNENDEPGEPRRAQG